MPLTVQQVIDAEEDLRDLAAIVNGAADLDVATRTGGSVPSLKKILAAAPGNVAKSASRAALAASAAMPNAVIALLEPGREGFFVFEDVDHSARVAADVAQGIYVAPATGPTGAAGAWVRKFSGPADVRWFGTDGIDDTAAFAFGWAVVDSIRAGKGTYVVTQIPVPSNKSLLTDGHETIIQQKAGTATDTQIIKIIGSNVNIGSLFVKGNFALAGEAVMGVATMTIANPGVVTRNAHGLAENSPVMFRTTGALPTGFVPELAYYVRNPTANTFQLALRPNGASIVTTGAQNGVHTLYHAGEHHHAVAIVADDETGDLSNITIGDIHGEDIRGDVFMTYSFNGKRIDDYRVGRLTGKRVYRCIAAPCAGNGEIVSVDGEEVGFLHFDPEPDGSCAPVEHLRVEKVKGRFAGVLGTDVTRYTDGVHIGTLDLDPAHGGGTGSTPPYPFASDLLDGLQVRNCKSLTIGKFKANGFNGQALRVIYNGGEIAKQAIDIRHAELTDNCKTEGALLTYVSAAAGVTRLSIGSLNVAITRATVSAIRGAYALKLGQVDAALAADTRLLHACVDGEAGPIYTSTTTTGILTLSSDGIKIKAGTVDVSRVFSYSANGRLEGGTVTAGLLAEGDGTDAHSYPVIIDSIINGTRYHLGIYSKIIFYRDGHILGSAFYNSSGDKIIGARGAAVAAGVNAAAAPTKAEFDALVTVVNALRDRLRAATGHGLIAD